MQWIHNELLGQENMSQICWYFCTQLKNGQRAQKLHPLRWSKQGRGNEVDSFWAGQLWCFLDFEYPHLGQTSPRVLQPSALGMQAKATGQALGRKAEAATFLHYKKRLWRSAYPIDLPFFLPCVFRCFPFSAAFSREPALKWMIACDRPIKSINPALIKQGMMN